MMSDGDEPRDVSRLIEAARQSDREATDRLLGLVYEQLRKLAHGRMKGEGSGHTLEATALVHEAYLRLVGERKLPWRNRAHFFAAAAEAMRRILLDYGKARGRQRRGGGRRRVPLSAAELAAGDDPAELLILDDAMCRLTERSPEMGEVVRLRFYAGLSVEECAAVLDVSAATVKRRWEFARTWLYRELREGLKGGDDGPGRSET